MRVLSRIELGVALLLMGLFLSYAALLDARAIGAQTDEGTTGGTTGGTTAQPNEGCENPTLVETFTGTENQLADPFQITGNTFRVSFETDPQNLDDTTTPTFEFDVLDEDGDPIGQGEIAFDGEDGSTNIIAGPGTFSLDLRADNVGYTVTVEDCVGNSDDGNGDDNNGNDNNNGGNDEDTDDDGVIDNTIPDKDLPDTGGSTALMVGGSTLLLLYGGLVAWRLKTRER